MKTGPLLLKQLLKQKKPGIMDMSPHHEILGEEVPDVPLTKIGRFRTQQMLRRKFGAGWKNVGHAKKIMSSFEAQMKAGS